MKTWDRIFRSSWNPWRDLGGLPRESWILAAASLINRAGTMVLPFLMLYLTRELGFTPPQAGLMLGIYGVTALLCAPLNGFLADRFGVLRVMKLSLVSSGFSLWLIPIAKTKWQVLVAVVVLAITSEAFRPANLAMVSDLAGPQLRKQGFALNRLSVNLGMSIGPALGGFLADVSFRSLFWVDGATSLAAGAVLWMTPFRTPVAEPHPHPGHAPVASRLVFHDRRLLYFLFAMLPILIVFFQHTGTMPLYMVQELGMSAAIFGLMFTINTLLIVLLEVRINSATAHWSHRRALALGAFLIGTGFGALALARDIPAVIATVVIWTAGEMIFLPTASAFVSEIAPRGRQGEYMGYYTMSFGLAYAIGPWLGSVVMQRYGSQTLWLGCFAFGLVSALLLMRMALVLVYDARHSNGAALARLD
jgi:MFS family permease